MRRAFGGDKKKDKGSGGAGLVAEEDNEEVE